jgi:hypothetical protein
MQRLQELEQERDKTWPSYSSMVGEIPLQVPDKERYYHIIFNRIQTVLREWPEELTVVLRRLEKEYQQQPAVPQRGNDRTDRQ